MLSTLRTRSSALSRQTVFLTRTYATVEGKSTTVTSEQTSQTPATVTGESSVPATEANAATTAGTPVVPATPTAPTASVVPTVKPGTLTSGQPGALRPHLNIPVNPNHGLYAFFRQKEADDGSVWYETVEPGTRSITESGRSWTAAELRRKSFRDLHVLWYICLRERNLLTTQREEARRMGIANVSALSYPIKENHCRKTMGRIKYVLNERRLAYTQALEIQANSKVNSEVEAQKQVEREAFEKEAIEFVKRERRAEKSAEVKAASKVEKRKPARAVATKAKA